MPCPVTFPSDLHWSRSQGSANLAWVLPALLACGAPRVVAEIGVCEGFTTEVLIRALEDLGGGRLVSVDTNPYSCAVARGVSEGLPVGHTVLQCDSRTMDWTGLVGKNGLGLALVDGDHEEASALADLNAIAPAVAPGGFVVVHDYAPGLPGPMRAVATFLETHKDWGRIVLAELVEPRSMRTAVLQNQEGLCLK